MFKSTNFLFAFLLFIISCGSSETPSFYFTKNGLKYEYHDIVTDGIKPKIGDFLNMYMELKTMTDSVLYSSVDKQLFGIESFKLKSSSINGGIQEGLLSIMEGDSVTFYLNTRDFFKYYFNEMPPVSMKMYEDVKITIRLISVKDSIEQSHFKKEQYLKLEKKEEFLIEDLLLKWRHKYDAVLKYGDVHIVPLNNNFLQVVNSEKETVKVFYSINLINGERIFSNFSEESFEFDMLSEYQMLDGFKYVVQQLNVGDHVLALVPSYLCFGSYWGLEGNIPPYSPLIFEINVVE